MAGFLGDAYSWVKALHIISVIAWMAGMLYLPRLYVYHCTAEPGSKQSETFKIMERRLLKAITTPAMIASWVFGLLLMVNLEAWTEPWFHAKLTLLIGMQIVHGALSRWRKAFERDENRHSETYYRYMNEVPTLLMIGIVIFVVVKPF
ncbi:protoporphyrinogen oxidase HemJ [Denitrobaculum tricleocarpae]|uniref:Protoporphyrinogen IX oxidase n=1 Tax=Denitrobaculum tricleocarpae TaxID=2591009 RepID=A0A545TRI6_9PROT|nr:protoporphyrinogen oxidase HemJ [Denitrobaculum tricleocarpae]TQV79833.1 protoporphyrinogen oxidase HemJ [Denitrobaculum tricleocarpae]